MKIYNNVLLSEILHYKIGGKTKFLLEAKNKDDVLQALDFVEQNKINKLFVVGMGANVLFPDSGFDGAVIRILNENNGIIKTSGEGLVEAFSGEILDNVIKFSFANNLVGLEWAGGLPGTAGAAVRGNVGAFGNEIKNVFHQAEVIQLKGNVFEVTTINNGEFSYRSSIVKKNKNMIIVSTVFKLYSADKTQVEHAKETYHKNIEYRQQNHPMEYPSCGSVFKNINEKEHVEKVLAVFPDLKEKIEKSWHHKVSVGHLITRLGLQGYQIGQAQISEKHANFIVNLGGAKYSDVTGIIKTVQEKFSDKFGFIPEPEVEIID